jgi:pimeloyl-ACP methyl ester carboxylesterase
MMQWRFHRDALPLEIYSWYLAVHESCSIDACFGLADLLLATDLTARLGEIRIPTLLLSPDASPFIPAQAMAGMHTLIVGSELQVFTHSKHGLPLSHGEVCAQVLSEFLERRCGRG